MKPTFLHDSDVLAYTTGAPGRAPFEVGRGTHVLAVSPHLDDAVASAGALLATCRQAGATVEILTVFAGSPGVELSPLAIEHHLRCGLGPDATAIRRREDRRAAEVLEATVNHLPVLDAVYRKSPSGGWLCLSVDDLFDPAVTDEPTGVWVEALVGQRLSAAPADVVLGPMAIGTHIDHRLTRLALEACAAQLAARVFLWGDQPYLAQSGLAAAARFGAVTFIPTPAALQIKRAAIAEYRSQLAFLADPTGATASPTEVFSRTGELKAQVL